VFNPCGNLYLEVNKLQFLIFTISFKTEVEKKFNKEAHIQFSSYFLAEKDILNSSVGFSLNGLKMKLKEFSFKH